MFPSAAGLSALVATGLALAQAAAVPDAVPGAVEVRSSSGLALPSVVLRKADGARVARNLDRGTLWLRRGEDFACVAAPGHVERAFAVVDGALVLEPAALFAIEGDFDCVERVGGVRCLLDPEEAPIDATDRELCFGRVGDRWLAAVSRADVDELRTWIRFRDGSYAAFAFRTASGGGTWSFECPPQPERGAVELVFEQAERWPGGTLQLRLEAELADGREELATDWGRVVRGPGRERREASLVPGVRRHTFDELVLGRTYRVTAVNSSTGGMGTATFVVAGRARTLELELEPGVVLTGRIVDVHGRSLPPGSVRVAACLDPVYAREALSGALLEPASATQRRAAAVGVVAATIDDDGFFRVVHPRASGAGAAEFDGGEKDSRRTGFDVPDDLAPPEPPLGRTAVLRVEARGHRAETFEVALDAADVHDCGELVLFETEAHFVLRPPAFGGLTGRPSIESLVDPGSVAHVVFDSAPNVLWKVERARVRDDALEVRLAPSAEPGFASSLARGEPQKFLSRPAFGTDRYATAALPEGPVEAVLIQADANAAFVRDDGGGFRALRLAPYEVELPGAELPAQLLVSWRSMPLAVEAERVGPELHALRFVGPQTGLVLRWRGGGTHLRPGWQRIER